MCIIRMILGIDCPGCGLLHAVGFLLQGEIEESIVLHPMAIVVVGWGFYQIVLQVLRQPNHPMISRWFSHGLVFGLAVFWVVKLAVFFNY